MKNWDKVGPNVSHQWNLKLITDEQTDTPKTFSALALWKKKTSLSPGQTIATCQHNILQRCWAQWCCVRLATLLGCVATCLVLLAQIWNCSNFSRNSYGCCIILHAFGQVCATMLHQDMHTSLICNTQHVAAHRNRAAKRTHVALDNVAICRVKMSRSFGWGLQILSQQCCDILRWNVAIVWLGRFGIANQTSAHTLAQHCCMNLAKRIQCHATSIKINVAWKIWTASNLSQQHQTCHNTSQ